MPDWPVYNAANQQAMIFGDEVRAGTQIDPSMLSFSDEYYSTLNAQK
jgi:hypothetical protein